MALENRDVRPFIDLHEVQQWLEENVLMTIAPSEGPGETTYLEPGSTYRLDPKSMVQSEIRIAIDEEATVGPILRSAEGLAKQLGSKDNSIFTVVIYGSSPYLRFTEELLRFPIEKLESLRGGHSLTPEGKRPASLRLPHHGSTIDLVVLLNKEVGKKPGLPHRLGTWLARIRFKLANPMEGIGFSPIPLTAEKRQELGLDKQTATFARVNPSQPDVLEATTLDDFVEFYVDEELLSRMSSNPRHPQSALSQVEIFLSAIKFVMMQIYSEPWLDDLKFTDVDEQLIGKLIRIVSNESASDLERSFEMFKNNPSLFTAQIENHCDYRRRLDDSLALMAGGSR